MDFMTALGCFERIEKFLTAESRTDRRFLAASETYSASLSEDSEENLNGAVNLSLLPGSRNENKASPMINVHDGGFGWKVDETPILSGINFAVHRSQIVMLIGPIASGKSTLMKGLLGETPLLQGRIYVPTSEAAWCEQTPWLMASYASAKMKIVLANKRTECYCRKKYHRLRTIRQIVVQRNYSLL